MQLKEIAGKVITLISGTEGNFGDAWSLKEYLWLELKGMEFRCYVRMEPEGTYNFIDLRITSIKGKEMWVQAKTENLRTSGIA